VISEEHTLPRLSDDDLREFIRDYLAGRIYTSAQIPEYEMRNLAMVFMPLALGALAEWSQAEFGQIGIFWEYLDKAGPRSINGMPGFFSFHMMHVEDWDRARKVIRREMRRSEELSLDVDDEEEDEPPSDRTDLEVALDIVQDGTADPELTTWALEILERNGVLTRAHPVPGHRGSTSSTRSDSMGMSMSSVPFHVGSAAYAVSGSSGLPASETSLEMRSRSTSSSGPAWQSKSGHWSSGDDRR
jgi:hypothetical protein